MSDEEIRGYLREAGQILSGEKVGEDDLNELFHIFKNGTGDALNRAIAALVQFYEKPKQEIIKNNDVMEFLKKIKAPTTCRQPQETNKKCDAHRKVDKKFDWRHNKEETYWEYFRRTDPTDVPGTAEEKGLNNWYWSVRDDADGYAHDSIEAKKTVEKRVKLLPKD